MDLILNEDLIYMYKYRLSYLYGLICKDVIPHMKIDKRIYATNKIIEI